MLAATLVAANGNSLAAISKEAPRAYDPMIFGSFLEHFHRQIYGGVFEPGSKLADADGFRTDVIAALKEIKTPIVRWPGGCFVSAYTMADAVFAACYLNAFLRNCDVVSIACFSPAVNTTGLVFTHANGLVKRTTFHVFKLYTGNLLPLVQPCATVSVPLTCGRNTVDALDMVVTTDTSRSRSVLAVVNKDPVRTLPLAIDFASLGRKVPASVSAEVLAGDSPDAYNDVGAENRVVPVAQTWKVAADGQVQVPPHSVSIVRID